MMKKARLIAGVTATIPAAAAGFAAPAAAHAAQATTVPAHQSANGKIVRNLAMYPVTHCEPNVSCGPQWAQLSAGEILFKRGGGTVSLGDQDFVFVSCYYSGNTGHSDPYWDHVTMYLAGHNEIAQVGHIADQHVDFARAHHYYPFSVGIHHCG